MIFFSLSLSSLAEVGASIQLPILADMNILNELCDVFKQIAMVFLSYSSKWAQFSYRNRHIHTHTRARHNRWKHSMKIDTKGLHFATSLLPWPPKKSMELSGRKEVSHGSVFFYIANVICKNI